jgi:hypothetical protein
MSKAKPPFCAFGSAVRLDVAVIDLARFAIQPSSISAIEIAS